MDVLNASLFSSNLGSNDLNNDDELCCVTL